MSLTKEGKKCGQLKENSVDHDTGCLREKTVYVDRILKQHPCHDNILVDILNVQKFQPVDRELQQVQG